MKKCSSAIVCFIFIGILSCGEVSIAADTLTISQPLAINDTLVSQQGRFQLGFFCPGISNKTYLGIWYTISPTKVVWVANRENPLMDASGVLSIGDDGNLLVLDESSKFIWSTNLTYAPGAVVAQLLDSGNFVLRDQRGTSVWESFDHPSHAMIPGMKLGFNSMTGLHLNLVSWKSSDDPSPGEYTYGVDTTGQAELVIWKGSSTLYRSGPWNRVSFGEVHIANDLCFTINVKVENEDAYYEYIMVDTSYLLMATISDDGVFQLLLKENTTADWNQVFTRPKGYCGNYMRCGPNSVCTNESPYCSCMTGYTPQNPKLWDRGVWSGGCMRKSQSNCSTLDTFEEYSDLKIPALLLSGENTSMTMEECRAECIKNCTCTAYANAYTLGEIGGCFLWFGDLVDVQKLDMGTNHLFIRAPSSDPITASSVERNSKKKWKIPLIVVMIIASTFLLSVVLFCIWMRKYQRKGGLRNGQARDEKNLELPCFDIVTIEKATQSFSDMNKIGEGGFGPVYKGKLSCGEEIAVKRLSETSCQGVNEFKNEVMLIAKLQHRNLVRLLGCCIHEEEKMLIYEYMANGSLDSYIFDGSKHANGRLLIWRQRFAIISGIARGLLYLHIDSRLRIIHRDLKASNVLLDRLMNPKISDFGMARAFGEEQLTTKTKRVAGTFGYMSPEYAIDGVYSMKSDVFSFGVLVLEIVSGRRNNQFHHPDHDFNLLGHAWKLLTEGRALELIDPRIEDSFSISEVLRCIQVALLCVQQRPEDRPTMASVLLMLNSVSAVLQQPKRPGFFTERSFDQTEVTCTILEGR